MKPRRCACLWTWAYSLLLIFTASASGQALSKAEKIETKLREEIIKTTKDIHVPILKAADLKAQIEDTNLVLIDVRDPKEQVVSMLPHALTTYQFAQRFKHGIPPAKRIVVYCTIGYRSGKYAEQLAKQNIVAMNLEGGILAWTFVGGVLYSYGNNDALTKTNRVHVYDKAWNLVHPDYVGVW